MESSSTNPNDGAMRYLQQIALDLETKRVQEEEIIVDAQQQNNLWAQYQLELKTMLDKSDQKHDCIFYQLLVALQGTLSFHYRTIEVLRRPVIISAMLLGEALVMQHIEDASDARCLFSFPVSKGMKGELNMVREALKHRQQNPPEHYDRPFIHSMRFVKREDEETVKRGFKYFVDVTFDKPNVLVMHADLMFVMMSIAGHVHRHDIDGMDRHAKAIQMLPFICRIICFDNMLWGYLGTINQLERPLLPQYITHQEADQITDPIRCRWMVYEEEFRKALHSGLSLFEQDDKKRDNRLLVNDHYMIFLPDPQLDTPVYVMALNPHIRPMIRHLISDLKAKIAQDAEKYGFKQVLFDDVSIPLLKEVYKKYKKLDIKTLYARIEVFLNSIFREEPVGFKQKKDLVGLYIFLTLKRISKSERKELNDRLQQSRHGAPAAHTEVVGEVADMEDVTNDLSTMQLKKTS